MIRGIEALSPGPASNPFKYMTSRQLLRAGQYLTDEGYRRDSTWAAVGASHGLVASIGVDVVVPGLGSEMTAPQRALMSHEAQIATALERGLCFTGDTPVLTHAGWRPIGEVEVGDRVWSCAEETGEECGWRRVVQVTEHGGGEVVRLEAVSALGDAVVVDVTVEHPFFVKGSGWRGAGELQEGDRLVGADGTELWVESLRPFAEGQRVYNLTVAVGHTYFVGGDDRGGQGVWTHNKGGGARGVPELPAALRGGEANTHVYLGVRDGEPVYAGITNDIARRQGQHGARFVLDQVTTSPVTRGEARAIEQALIQRNPGFENIRNSISPSHSYYQQAVDYGEAWLTSHGY